MRGFGYNSNMNKSEILKELPNLTREERREIISKVHEIDGDDWMDEGELTEEEKVLIESRISDHEKNPSSALSWQEFERRLNSRISK
jgi:putative addiction module component (TIGR02574 family)